MASRQKTKHRGKRGRTPTGCEAYQQQPPQKNRALPARVLGIPPTKEIDKHPDEVYGDTEIPHRSRNSGRAY
jgi:hypothetical protein